MVFFTNENLYFSPDFLPPWRDYVYIYVDWRYIFWKYIKHKKKIEIKDIIYEYAMAVEFLYNIKCVYLSVMKVPFSVRKKEKHTQRFHLL